jgi:hypothetical protein
LATTPRREIGTVTANRHFRYWLGTTAKLILATAVYGVILHGHVTWLGASGILVVSAALGGVLTAVWALIGHRLI